MSTNPPARPNVRVLWGLAIAAFDPVSMRIIASDATTLSADLEYISAVLLRRSEISAIRIFYWFSRPVFLEFGKPPLALPK